MSASPNLQLPYLDANQNQKSVTHNQALRMLDALVNLGVQSSTLQAPPAVPADGQRWIVAPGGIGAWAGRDLTIAAWQDGAWSFFAPGRGTLAYDAAGTALLFWTGTAWRSIASLLALLGVTALGIGTAADAANPLSATLNNALFNALSAGAGGSGDVRIKLNKAAAGNTASFLFQDGFSGRAEIGLAGDDSFHVKVSPDGSAFVDAMVVAANGAVAFAASPTAPTPAPGDSGSRLATTAFVAAAVAALVAAAPGALDTLKDLADALGDDPNFAATVTSALAARAPLVSPALTGAPTAPTPAFSDTSTRLATTAFVAGAIDPLSVSPVHPTLDYRLTAPDCVPPGQFTRLSSGTRTTSAGLLVPVAAGGLRIDHDPVTGAPLGALFEEQRTNLLLYSQDLSNPYWVKRGGLAPTGGQTAPDGTATAWQVLNLGAAGPSSPNLFAYSGGAAAAAAYEPSFWLKPISTAGILTLLNPSGSAGEWSVDLSKLSSGWQRVTKSHPSVTVVHSFTADSSGGIGHYYCTYGSAVSFFWWGGQAEPSVFATSYIATTGAQATRAADSLVVPVTTDWFNTNEGTLYVEASFPMGISPQNYSGIFAFADSSSVNVLGIYLNANSDVLIQCFNNGAIAETAGGLTSIKPGASLKIAASYNNKSISISANGGVAASKPVSQPLNLVSAGSNVHIGSWTSGQAPYTGQIRRASYIPRALTAAQLQAMTS